MAGGVAALTGVEVVITRPLAQARTWQRQLEALGARARSLPVLEIAPLADDRERAAARRTIMDFADYHKVIFVSRNAVHHTLQWLDRYWPQLPAGMQYVAVGSATARAAREGGLNVEEAGSAMDSEALLQMSALQSVNDQKILICRGVGGRPYLAEQLRQRGARVDFCELYRRRLPDSAPAQFARLLDGWSHQKPETHRIIAVHSGESLDHFDALVSEAAADWLREYPLLTPGERVASRARDRGYQRVVGAANATDEAMTQALYEACSISARRESSE